MSGTLVIWSLVSQNAPVLAVVPLVRIKEWDLPVGTTMPAIVINSIDDNIRLTVAMTETPRMHVERVQVTPLIKGTAETPVGLGKKGVDSLLALILAACPNQRGTIAGVAVDSILPAGYGPDLSDLTAGIFTRSIDFFVRWNGP